MARGANGNRKNTKRRPKSQMSDAAFDDLIESFNQVIQYERGERNDLRITVREAPAAPKLRGRKEIVALRHRLKYSQGMLARVLNVSPKTVQAWEAGTRMPSDAALKLLAIADKHPEVLFDSV